MVNLTVNCAFPKQFALSIFLVIIIFLNQFIFENLINIDTDNVCLPFNIGSFYQCEYKFTV